MSRNARVENGILDRIVRTKLDEVAALASRRAELRAAAETAPAARPFARALRRPGQVSVIAEFKRRSPSAGDIAGDRNVVEVARAYEGGGATAMSVLTDATYFGGSLRDLRAAREACALPVLRKDFIADEVQIWEARAAGADAVLLIVRMLDDARVRAYVALATELGFAALVEVHDARELERALAAGAGVIGINNRDLAAFRTDLAISETLAREVPGEVVLVAESGIRDSHDVVRLGACGVDAILVGETLMRASDIPGALRSLVGLRSSPSARAGSARAGASASARGDQRTSVPVPDSMAPDPMTPDPALRTPRIKICGICRPADAAEAVRAGADYLGVILSSGFPRTRGIEDAAEIFAAGGEALRAGVFVDEEPERVIEIARRLLLDVVQLHGAESPGHVARIGQAGPWRVWKSVRPHTGHELREAEETYRDVADGLLIEGRSEKGVGGVGALADWTGLAGNGGFGTGTRRLEWIAAGGLSPENVEEVVRTIAPDVVDVSSGVEQAPGRKSVERMHAFVAAARGPAEASQPDGPREEMRVQ